MVNKMFDLNALGPIRIAQILLPKMLEAGSGRFVVVSSMAAKIPSPGQALYA
ncbi:unnamed protein product, partial [Ostreobium quekettii]